METKSQKALGIDIGGTKIYAAVVDKNGKILSDIKKYATPKTRNEIENCLKSIIAEFEAVIDVVGISTAGSVSNDNTRILGSTGNLCKDYPKINFMKLSDKKVVLENDANCADWAEYKIGAAKDKKNIVVLTLGTGVGGGIIVNGQLLKGKNGAAGEMHFKMSRNKRRQCTCGAYDCFEIYASGTGMRLSAQELSGNPAMTTYDVIDGVKKNDELCLKIFNTWQNDIIDGIIGLANIFDPDCVVLSGSMAEFVDYTKVTEAVNKEIVTTPTKVVPAKYANNSGLIGAALFALDAKSD